MEHDKTQMTFNAPVKPPRERIYSKLEKIVANTRGKYFRTNFSRQLQYGTIDSTSYLINFPILSIRFSFRFK